MTQQRERELMARAVSLGESGQAEAVTDLLALVESLSAQVRRLAVSALGKLAGVAEADAVVPALSGRLRDPHPQVRQYAIKAVSAYGAAAEAALPDLQDIAGRPAEKDYNRRDAEKAIATLREAKRIALEEAQVRCPTRTRHRVGNSRPPRDVGLSPGRGLEGGRPRNPPAPPSPAPVLPPPTPPTRSYHPFVPPIN